MLLIFLNQVLVTAMAEKIRSMFQSQQTKYPVKFEFQINNKIFSHSMPQILEGEH